MAAILERFDAADRRIRQARTIPDREAAEAERRETMGDYYAASAALGDLFLLLFRHAMQHRQEALQTHLVSLLDPELDQLADAIAESERRRR